MQLSPNKGRRLLAAKQARRLCAGHAHWRAYSSLRDSQTAGVHRPEVTHMLAQCLCAVVARATLVLRSVLLRLASQAMAWDLLSASSRFRVAIALGLKPEALQQQCPNRRMIALRVLY